MPDQKQQQKKPQQPQKQPQTQSQNDRQREVDTEENEAITQRNPSVGANKDKPREPE